ncbi:hypothetical protein A9Z42_0030650 [Trichoderma parareesei]|uniref:PH domain-containing protein n=1 Tax=Trichoderma parareesei TaxID=858221 RepID=A0A2H2Z4R6_TRIPA|nr:hypothetical protein A9Z42_0030650 [Trichoderma parareesei]
MDYLDGLLLVPPDRNHILAKAQWKTRYVFVGRRTATTTNKQKDRQSAHGAKSAVSDPKTLTKVYTDEYCLSVYKAKEDMEPAYQWPTSCVLDCQVQMLAYRKQGPIQPTLVVTISDKERKRRSSRSVGLMASKDAGTSTLWFRTPPDDHHSSLHDWASFILSKKNPVAADGSTTPIFSSPFSPRSREAPDNTPPRPDSGNPASSSRPDARALQHKSSSATYSTGPRERPATFSSDSPSLRSKRSDISSPSSISQHPMQKAFAAPGPIYTGPMHGDSGLPPIRDSIYQGDLIEGWTAAQGRSSTLSSPTRGPEPLGSPMEAPLGFDVHAPPAPGETILDRAFQLGHIPWAGSNVPGQETFSSIARFDALMHEVEDKRKQREATRREERAAMRNTYNPKATPLKLVDDFDSEESAHSADEQDHGYDRSPIISPSAQRALAFIANRHGDAPREPGSRRPTISRTHLSYHAGAAPPPPLPLPTSRSPPSRPHTAHAKSRLNPSQRTQSTPHLNPDSAGRSVESGFGQDDGDSRRSGSSSKRLSFSDFTRRLSSTSSLLVVQTNTSGDSRRGSVETDHHSLSARRPDVSHRDTVPPPRSREWQRQDRQCPWRNSVGVVGPEGGFL